MKEGGNIAGLNEKQKKFIEEYVICLNATEAAKKAGYSKKTAYSIGQENLKKPEIKKAINEYLKKIQDEKIANAKEVMEHLTRVLRGEQMEETIVIEGQGNGISKARKIKKEISPKDRLKAAELLGKRYGLFNDKLEHSGEVKAVVLQGSDNLE